MKKLFTFSAIAAITILLGFSLFTYTVLKKNSSNDTFNTLAQNTKQSDNTSVQESVKAPTKERGEREEEEKGKAHKHEFNDFFFTTRAYPDKTFDYKSYISAIKTVNNQIHSPEFKASAAFDGDWRVEGPNNIGGRVNAIAVHPNDSDIIYAGSAAGGVFKTIDGGENWEPIFDEQPFLTIGTIEIDPNDSNTIYVGTGDVNIGGYVAIGNGLYRSTDAGETWEHLGLEEQRIISKVKIDYSDSDIIYVSTMGLPFERDEKRGVYKSTDGGQSWEQVLFASEQAGAIDLLMDHENPDILYTAFWNRIRNNQESLTYGEDARIWKTIDGGENWEMLEGGLPMGENSRIGLAMSATNPNKIYSVYVNTDHNLEGIYVTEDGGENWEALETSYLNDTDFGGDILAGFGWYFAKIAVNPIDDDHVFVLGVDLWQTSNMGTSWSPAVPNWWTYEVHADKHAFVAIDENTFLLGTDGGMYRTTNGGNDWEDIESLPITQIYRVENNHHIVGGGEYTVGCQDNGTTTGNFETGEWPRLNGGDGFQAIHDTDDPDIVYAEVQNGNLFVSTGGSFQDFNFGIDDNDRRNWDMQYIISPHNPDVLYTGTYRMYKTQDGPSADWFTISDMLTKEVENHPRYHVFSGLDESPVVQGKLYVGTSDAKVWLSPDDGNEWIDISAGLPERYVTSIKASPTDANTVYVTHSGYKDNDNIPHVHKSIDNGETWIDISTNLPEIACNDIFIMPEHNDSVLFVATDVGVYASIDYGINWDRIGTNMPTFKVFDLDVDIEDKRLVAATYARSVWSFDLKNIINFSADAPPELIVSTDPISIYEGNEFMPPTATATDGEDGDITDLIVISNPVDVNTPGNYTVTYTVTDSGGNQVSETITVTILDDDMPPVITVDSEDEIEIVLGEEFTLPTANAYDDIDGDLTEFIVIDDSQLDLENTGTYIVTYTVMDIAGNSTTYTLTVNIANVTGIDNAIWNKQWTIYPNPAINDIQLQMSPELQAEITQIQLTDVSGRIIQTFDKTNAQISLNTLPSGIYNIHLKLQKGGQVNKAFVKQ